MAPFPKRIKGADEDDKGFFQFPVIFSYQCLSNYYGAYHALEDLYADGKIRTIGVEN